MNAKVPWYHHNAGTGLILMKLQLPHPALHNLQSRTSKVSFGFCPLAPRRCHWQLWRSEQDRSRLCRWWLLLLTQVWFLFGLELTFQLGYLLVGEIWVLWVAEVSPWVSPTPLSGIWPRVLATLSPAQRWRRAQAGPMGSGVAPGCLGNSQWAAGIVPSAAARDGGVKRGRHWRWWRRGRWQGRARRSGGPPRVRARRSSRKAEPRLAGSAGGRGPGECGLGGRDWGAQPEMTGAAGARLHPEGCCPGGPKPGPPVSTAGSEARAHGLRDRDRGTWALCAEEIADQCELKTPPALESGPGVREVAVLESHNRVGEGMGRSTSKCCLVAV